MWYDGWIRSIVSMPRELWVSLSTYFILNGIRKIMMMKRMDASFRTTCCYMSPALFGEIRNCSERSQPVASASRDMDSNCFTVSTIYGASRFRSLPILTSRGWHPGAHRAVVLIMSSIASQAMHRAIWHGPKYSVSAPCCPSCQEQLLLSPFGLRCPYLKTEV